MSFAQLFLDQVELADNSDDLHHEPLLPAFSNNSSTLTWLLADSPSEWLLTTIGTPPLSPQLNYSGLPSMKEKSIQDTLTPPCDMLHISTPSPNYVKKLLSPPSSHVSRKMFVIPEFEQLIYEEEEEEEEEDNDYHYNYGYGDNISDSYVTHDEENKSINQNTSRNELICPSTIETQRECIRNRNFNDIVIRKLMLRCKASPHDSDGENSNKDSNDPSSGDETELTLLCNLHDKSTRTLSSSYDLMHKKSRYNSESFPLLQKSCTYVKGEYEQDHQHYLNFDNVRHQTQDLNKYKRRRSPSMLQVDYEWMLSEKRQRSDRHFPLSSTSVAVEHHSSLRNSTHISMPVGIKQIGPLSTVPTRRKRGRPRKHPLPPLLTPTSVTELTSSPIILPIEAYTTSPTLSLPYGQTKLRSDTIYLPDDAHDDMPVINTTNKKMMKKCNNSIDEQSEVIQLEPVENRLYTLQESIPSISLTNTLTIKSTSEHFCHLHQQQKPLSQPLLTPPTPLLYHHPPSMPPYPMPLAIKSLYNFPHKMTCNLASSFNCQLPPLELPNISKLPNAIQLTGNIQVECNTMNQLSTIPTSLYSHPVPVTVTPIKSASHQERVMANATNSKETISYQFNKTIAETNKSVVKSHERSRNSPSLLKSLINQMPSRSRENSCGTTTIPLARQRLSSNTEGCVERTKSIIERNVKDTSPSRLPLALIHGNVSTTLHTLMNKSVFNGKAIEDDQQQQADTRRVGMKPTQSKPLIDASVNSSMFKARLQLSQSQLPVSPYSIKSHSKLPSVCASQLTVEQHLMRPTEWQERSSPIIKMPLRRGIGTNAFPLHNNRVPHTPLNLSAALSSMGVSSSSPSIEVLAYDDPSSLPSTVWAIPVTSSTNEHVGATDSCLYGPAPAIEGSAYSDWRQIPTTSLTRSPCSSISSLSSEPSQTSL